MKNRLRTVSVSIAVCLIWSSVQAAEWESSITKDGRVVVSITGEIIQGNSESF